MRRRASGVALATWVVAAGLSGCAVDLTPRATGEPDARPGRTVEPCDGSTTDRDPANCGACGRACEIANATAGCEAGECVIASCDAGSADADGLIENGCEAGAECPSATVAVHRAYATGHVYSTDLAFAQTPPNQLEVASYFALRAEAGPGLQPIYRCSLGGARSFITPDPACEGGYPRVEELGYMATAAVCGAVPVYRLYHPGAGDHLFTTSAAERDAVIVDNGYQLVGEWGFVWAAP